MIRDTNKLISIIITYYNLGEFIEETIQSIFQQTYKNIEIIFVNDGTDDEKSLKKLNELKAKYKNKIIFVDQVNKGLPNARNHGIKLSHGEYVCCMDADDKIEPLYIEKLFIKLEENLQAGISSPWVQLFGEENSIWKTSEMSTDTAMVKNSICVSSLFRKVCWEKVGGYDEKMKFGYEDWDFWISIVKKGYKTVIVAEPLFLYRIRDNSMLKKAENKRIEIINYLMIKHSDLLKKNSLKIFLEKEKEIIYYKNQLVNSNKEKEKEIIYYKNQLVNSNKEKEKEISLLTKNNKILDSKIKKILKNKKIIENELGELYLNYNKIINSKKWKLVYELHKLISSVFKNQITLKITKYFYKKNKKIYFLMKNFYKKAINFLKESKQKKIVIKNKLWSTNKPLISVIIPCYNYGKYLSEAVNSVLDQTFQNFEIIIVNDGSTDKFTKSIIKEISLKNKKIKTINQENLGVSNARNTGIKNSLGKYICCLDADDKLDPTYIEKCLYLMESKKLDVCGSWLKEFENGNCIWKTSDLNLSSIMNSNSQIISSIFTKKIWKKTGGYSLRMKSGYEDWEFWINAVEHGARGMVIKEPLFFYRKHHNSRNVGADKNKDVLIKEIRSIHSKLYKSKLYRNIIKFNSRIIYIVKNPHINIISPSDYLTTNSNKKSILILLPWLTFGGAETLLYNYLSIIKNDFNISIITGLESKNEWEDKFKEITKNIYHLPNLFLKSSQYEDFLKFYIKSRNIELLHIVHNSVFYDYLPNLKKLFPKIIIVSTNFNVIAHYENSINQAKYIDAYTTDNSIVYNQYTTNKKLSNKKLVLIPNGIDCENKFNPKKYNRSKKRTELEFKRKETVFAFIGRLSPEKNPQLFVKVAKILIKKYKSLKFIVIGEGIIKDEIVKDIINFDSDKLLYLGYKKNIANYLNAIDVFILPSTIEGFSLSIIEAMAMKKCVIASNVGGTRDIIKDRTDGFLFDSKSSTDLIKKIEYVIDDENKDHINKIKESARKKVLNKFSINRIAKEYKKLYENG